MSAAAFGPPTSALTAGMIRVGRSHCTNDLSSPKLECSLYGSLVFTGKGVRKLEGQGSWRGGGVEDASDTRGNLGETRERAPSMEAGDADTPRRDRRIDS